VKRKVFNILVILAMLLSIAPAAFAQGTTPPDRMAGEVPARVTDNKLETPIVDAEVTGARLDGSLLDATGPTQVIIRLRSDSVVERNIQGRSAQRIQRLLKTQQDNFLSRLEAMGANARVIAQVQMVMNAVFVEVDASALATIARDPMVARIAPVGNYELDLSETVPYIGGSAMQAMGFDGTGRTCGGAGQRHRLPARRPGWLRRPR
jgi:minor extracellular serine protease Vpr